MVNHSVLCPLLGFPTLRRVLLISKPVIIGVVSIPMIILATSYRSRCLLGGQTGFPAKCVSEFAYISPVGQRPAKTTVSCWTRSIHFKGKMCCVGGVVSVYGRFCMFCAGGWKGDNGITSVICGKKSGLDLFPNGSNHCNRVISSNLPSQ